MNSKQVTVAILFVITLILGGFTLYLAYNLSQKQSEKPTPTPTIKYTPTITTTIEPTEDISPTNLPEVKCGENCNNAICEEGYSCIFVNSIKKCVLDTCIDKTQTPLELNNKCNSDLCSIKTDITITKTSTFSCHSSGTKVKVTINVNNRGSEEVSGLLITDDLTSSFSSSYIVTQSISNSGNINANKINWNNIRLAPNNGSIILTYEAIFPNSESGKTYTNPLTISKDNNTLVTITHTFTVNIIPCTDLESDQVLMIIGGLILIGIAVLYIRNDYDRKFGNLFWFLGLENVYLSIMNKIKKDKNFKFEKLIIKDKNNE